MLEAQRTFDSHLGTLPAFDSQARGANIPRPAQWQNYISDQRGHETSVQVETRNYDKYEFPTSKMGYAIRTFCMFDTRWYPYLMGTDGMLRIFECLKCI